MIAVHRLDGSEFHLNADLVETIEANPDTVVTLTSSRKLVVRESPREIIESIIRFRRQVFAVGPQLVDR